MKTRWMIPAVAALAVAPAACQELAAQVTDTVVRTNEADGRFRPGGAGILELREELGLTEVQTSSIQEILDELRRANAPLMQQVRDERRGTGREVRRGQPSEAMRQLRDNSAQAMRRIQEVLTPEQRDAARQLMSEQRERARALRSERGPRQERTAGERGARQDRTRSERGPGADRMRPEGGADAGGAGLLRLRERLGLTADQVARIESIQEALRENARAARAQMQDVLTAEQQATLEEIRAERPRRGRPNSG